MFQLDIQGKCETCLQTAKESEILCCDTCQFFYHAFCDSVEGNSDGIAKKTHLGLHKQASTKKNFIWKCDRCLTISEQNAASSVRDMISTLVDRIDQFETQLPQKIKEIVQDEFQRLNQSQAPDIDKLCDSLVTKMSNSNPVKPISINTPWSNDKRVEDMKSSMLIKADKDGKPVDPGKVRKTIMDNGVPVNKVVVTSSGDTFINCPNQQSRDKLHPLLHSENNNVVLLKSKLPTISLFGVTDDLSKEEIKQGIINQNEAIGKLVTEQHEELEVIYTRAPPQGKSYYQVTLRVSPLIRKAIANLGNKLFLSSKSCNVEDSFHIKRCNKCQSFGHYAAKCDEETPTVCGYCGEHHKSNKYLLKDSASITHKCFNCQAAGMEEFEGHSTFSRKCPAYIIEQKKLANSIAYNYQSN